MRKRLLVLSMAAALVLTSCGKKVSSAVSDSPDVSESVGSIVEIASDEIVEVSDISEVSQDSSVATYDEIQEAVTEIYKYIHDPLVHVQAIVDVIVDENAIYGFSPNPESSRLGTYAEYDWSDPVVVEAGREDRIAYHKSIESMYEMLDKMMVAGEDIETIARNVSAERNRIRLASYDGDPDGLAKVKESNLAEYGDENGPTADSLFEKYGSWEKVLEKAFSVNMGMDICLGLYDEYYNQYLELGLFPNIIDEIIANNSSDIFAAKIKEFTDSLAMLGLSEIDEDKINLAVSMITDIDGFEIVSEKIDENGLADIELRFSNSELIESAVHIIGMADMGIKSVKMTLKVNPESYEIISGESFLVTDLNEITLFKY